MKAEFYNLLRMDTFVRKLLFLTAMFTLGVTITLSAQQVFKYSGKVTDNAGEPLPGVNVIEKGTSNGAITSMDGEYELTSANNPITITFSMVGFETIDQISEPGQVANITLGEDVIGLDEVLVVGYGTQKRANVTGAIATMNSEQLVQIPVGTVNEALQGRLAGVNVTQNSGSPGSGLSVVIRGVATNGNTQPLYVVDGIRTTNIDNIEPYDVQSIEVLKDAASAAIYGADAANGVVMITTKKGTKGPGRINFNFQYGINSLPKVTEPMDAQSYQTWVTEANVGVEPENIGGYNTNWMDEISSNAPSQRYNLSFSGGTEHGSYFISGSYLNAQGMVGGDKAGYERFILRANIEQQIKKWVKVGTNMNYMRFDRQAIAEDDEFGGVIASALMLDPMTPVAYVGQLGDNLDADNYDQYSSAVNNGLAVMNGDGQYYGVSNWVKGEIANPLAQIDVTQGSTIQDKFMGNLYVTLGGDEWKGISFTSRVSTDIASQLYHTWYPTYWYSSERQNSVANTRSNTDTWYSWMWENFLSYDHTFNGKHHVNLMAGISAQQGTHNYLTTLSGPMFAQANNYAQHGPVEIDGTLSGSLEDTRLQSYYGRAFYEYDGRYVANFTFRRDGTSLLGSNNRWGNFPAISAGWIISGEKFWNVDFIDFLKIRGSWGVNGMLSGLQPDQFRALITTSGIKYPKPGGGFYTGAEPELLANDELVWASSQQIDIGFDMYMWSNRLSFGFDYFNKVTKDLLTPGTPPPSVGNYAPFVNAGDVTNNGIEFEAGLRKMEGKFNYSINVNYTYMTNEVTYLNPLLTRVGGSSVGTGWTATWFELNQPVWYFRGYQTEGIFQNQGQIDDYIAQYNLQGYNPKPGDPIVSNTNGDEYINDEDQTYIGDPHPNHMWGAMFNFAYSGFDLRLFVQGVHGQDVLLGWNRYDRSTSNRPQFYFDERWTGEGSTNERPRADQSSPYIYNSDLMVYSGSYVRIRQIQLGYTIPRRLMKDKVQNLRVYISMDDYFTFTNYPGMDPEGGTSNDNGQGIDRGYYPTPRKLIFGLSFTF